ncbi:hypothetical protein L211DRAFT_853460 [Terfezia boudieri ATCC MYA-4762]|uniref:Uncharacterized protein n=1 Tax=Terfezia boudieri ATCC MYA-4762 TaxID=1051890 RepID=A0A3N4LCJ2_9PEZI|nr:hypothetical protein L211DRAFT_853460 [Terfezia boudieri ATCC MYA-4762]
MHASVDSRSDNEEVNTAAGAPDQSRDVAVAQQQVHRDRMTEFMSVDGVWSGGFTGCSKRMQGVLIYQIGRDAWAWGDFASIPPGQHGFKDAVAKKYMEFQHQLRMAKRVKCSMSLKELQTMPSKTITKCIPKEIVTKFKQRHPITDEDLKDFTQHTSSPQPLILAGCKDKKILAFRIRIPEAFLSTLKETKHLLPTHAEAAGRRGEYKTRNYCLWAKYADHPYMSANLLEDGKGAKEWLSTQAPLFKHLSEVRKLVDFESYERMTTHPWLDKLLVNQAKHLGQKVVAGGGLNMPEIPLHKVAGIWYGLAVNCDQEFAGVPHRDGNDVKNSMNCVIPWGSWEGADLLFWEVR